MDNITIGQIVAVIGTLTVIVGFFYAIFKWYKTTFIDRFSKIENRLKELEEKTIFQDTEIKESKDERLILLQGVLACLEGQKQLGANGPVTEAINKINNYLISKTHK